LWERAAAPGLATADDRLLSRLNAPPDLAQGTQSLAYWHDRRRSLSWYRIRARREAASMILRWEHRVRRAILSQPDVPITVRTSAGLLVARTRAWRWGRRAAITLTALVGVTLMASPVVGAVILLGRAF
jgi:hypothetical protein